MNLKNVELDLVRELGIKELFNRSLVLKYNQTILQDDIKSYLNYTYI